MTKDELIKRLVKIDGRPISYKAPPRDPVRRDFNEVINTSDDGVDNFDSFFDFEKDISELEAARNQIEKIEKIMTANHTETIPEEKSFIFLDEDPSAKSGSEDSCFIFEEESDTTINNDNVEVPQEALKPTTEADLEVVNRSTEVIEENNTEVIEKNNTEENSLEKNIMENISEEIKVNFKVCKYIKNDGENCKRQAPKDSEYCSSHRKVLAKEVR